MKVNQFSALKEQRSHGTIKFPCAYYQHDNDFGLFHLKHHWHDEPEIIYFSKGELHIEINMEMLPVQEECFCFINPGEIHYAFSPIPCDESAIVFHPKLLSFDTYDPVQAQIIQPLMNGTLLLPRYINRSNPLFAPLLSIYEEMTSEFRKAYPNMHYISSAVTDNLVSQLSIKSNLLKVLALLLSYDLLVQTERDTDIRIETIKTSILYMKENYERKLYIKDLAHEVNMNEQYFCRFFKKAIGTSPMKYLNEIRIKRAMEKLETTELSITDIALDCGFHNLGNFLREFKVYNDTTPLQYKKNLSSEKSK